MIIIKPCEQADIDQLKPNIRSEECVDVQSCLGMTAQENLQAAFDNCYDINCIRDEENVYVVFGVAPLPRGLAVDGYMYLICAENWTDINKDRRFNTRLARAWVAEMKEKYEAITCAIKDEPFLRRWMKHLKFNFVHNIEVNGQKLLYFSTEIN